jgi:hypothetical protein
MSSHEKQAEMFIHLLEAAIKDAAYHSRVSRLNITVGGEGFTKPVRVVILPETPVVLAKEDIEKQIRLLHLTQGFHYTSDGLRVIITPEEMEIRFK